MHDEWLILAACEYMLEGEVVYRHGSNLYPMKPGDSLFFDADAPHGPEQLTKKNEPREPLFTSLDLPRAVHELAAPAYVIDREGRFRWLNPPFVELLGDPIVTSWDGARDRVHHGVDLNSGAGWFIAEKRRYADPRLTETADLRAVADLEQVVMLCSYVPDDEAAGVAAAVQAAVGEGARVWAALNAYSPGWSEVVVQSPLATKGAAILELRQRLGLAGEITVCGDHVNDLPMFAVADRRVAPANAQPEVRAAASVVTGANDDDGVVTYLLEQLAIRRREADE